MLKDTSSNHCQAENIAAYLDGELERSSGFEQHLEECSVCGAELNAQRLFVCELDSAFELTAEVPLPQNFAQIVAARAESDMSGVREGVEHKRALRLGLILALTSFALMGAAAGKTLLSGGWAAVETTIGIFRLVWTTMYDAAVGLTVISRVVGSGIVPESHFAGLAALLLALAIVLLSLLISSYHRHHQIRLFE